MNISYENLDLIPELYNIIVKLSEDIEVLKSYKPDLTKPFEVSKFLGISRSTLYNQITNGILKEGIHYSKKGGKTVFISDAILKYKETFIKHAKSDKTTTRKVDIMLAKLKEVA